MTGLSSCEAGRQFFGGTSGQLSKVEGTGQSSTKVESKSVTPRQCCWHCGAGTSSLCCKGRPSSLSLLVVDQDGDASPNEKEKELGVAFLEGGGFAKITSLVASANTWRH